MSDDFEQMKKDLEVLDEKETEMLRNALGMAGETVKMYRRSVSLACATYMVSAMYSGASTSASRVLDYAEEFEEWIGTGKRRT